jgi:hypothetical protein
VTGVQTCALPISKISSIKHIDKFNIFNSSELFDVKQEEDKKLMDEEEEIIIDCLLIKQIENEKFTHPNYDCKTKKDLKKLRNFIRSQCNIWISSEERLKKISRGLVQKQK